MRTKRRMPQIRGPPASKKWTKAAYPEEEEKNQNMQNWKMDWSARECVEIVDADRAHWPSLGPDVEPRNCEALRFFYCQLRTALAFVFGCQGDCFGVRDALVSDTL